MLFECIPKDGFVSYEATWREWTCCITDHPDDEAIMSVWYEGRFINQYSAGTAAELMDFFEQVIGTKAL